MESEMGSIESAGIGGTSVERGRINGVGAKRRKSSSSGGEVCTIDRISDLPESIILHILSLIPTEEAFKTSLLSKSWILYWTTVSKFVFDEELWPKDRHIDFVEFVNMVLANHTYEYIHCLYIRWTSSKLEPSNFVATAISLNLRRLDLACAAFRRDIRLPDALYTCTTLEYLALIGPFLVSVSDCVVRLPRLSQLRLCNVVAESNESLPKILSGCPVLHSLHIIKRRQYECELISTISSASLKCLKLDFSEKPSWPWISNPNTRLEIDAPALQVLHVIDLLSGKVSIRGGMNQLYDGLLKVPCLLGRKDMCFARLVEVFSGVKILTVSDETMKAISKRLLPRFKRLIALRIEFTIPGWPSPVDLMDSCFNLRYLYIVNLSSIPDDASSVYNQLVRIPRCVSSSLKFVAFVNFDERGEEMLLLKFILLHGRVLDTVYLWYKNYVPSDFRRRHNILNQVSRLPKASPSCKISEWNPRLVLDWVGDSSCKVVKS